MQIVFQLGLEDWKFGKLLIKRITIEYVGMTTSLENQKGEKIGELLNNL